VPSVRAHTFSENIIGAAYVGRVVLFAQADGVIQIDDGETVRAVTAHDGSILATARTGDGRRLLTAGDDGRVVATDIDGTVEELVRKPGKWLDVVAGGPQGAVGYASGKTAWVRLADGSEKTFPHERAVSGLAFAPKGLRIATATYDMARTFYVATDIKPTDLAWKGAHLDVVWSPDGTAVITSMMEMALHGWRLDDAKHMRMTGYPAKPRSMSWSKGGKWLATSGAQAAIVWPFSGKDGPIGKAPLQLGPYSKLSTRVAFHPTEEVVVIGYEDGLILAVRLDDQAEVGLRAATGHPITAFAWDAKGLKLAFGTESGEAGIIDLAG
jgi:WD40 repeat protein